MVYLVSTVRLVVDFLTKLLTRVQILMVVNFLGLGCKGSTSITNFSHSYEKDFGVLGTFLIILKIERSIIERSEQQRRTMRVLGEVAGMPLLALILLKQVGRQRMAEITKLSLVRVGKGRSLVDLEPGFYEKMVVITS